MRLVLAALLVVFSASTSRGADLGLSFPDLEARLSAGAKAFAKRYNTPPVSIYRRESCTEKDNSYVCLYLRGELGLLASAPGKDKPIQFIGVVGRESLEFDQLLGTVMATLEPSASSWLQGTIVRELVSKNGTPAHLVVGQTVVYSGHLIDGRIMVNMLKP